MLTQISLMPTSRRCFGNPSSIVPSKAVCTKHRVLCTQQTRSSRGTLIPSAERRGVARARERAPLDGFTQCPRLLYSIPCRFGVAKREREREASSRRITGKSAHSRRDAPYLTLSWTSRRVAAGSAANTRACRALCVSFICAARSAARAMILDRRGGWDWDGFGMAGDARVREIVKLQAMLGTHRSNFCIVA